MKHSVWLLVALTVVVWGGCFDEIDARWQLDHDHVVVARATPPRVRSGDATNLDALVAHAGRGVSIENPLTAEVGSARFAAYLSQHDGAWTLTAPDAQVLASARPALGLPEDAPVPVEVLLTFPRSTDRDAPDPVRVKKTVWLGEPSENPVVPPVTIDGAPAGDEVVVPLDRDVYLTVLAQGMRVNWLTSVGTLFQDDEATAFVHVAPDDKPAGELVVVVRDDEGGVAWRVWPMRAE
ncbi:MAG TPA: hypothetical protein VFV99_12500 [Kofleriaceae bacterium]|nr:hypothetical protein [Kofleriaceae bacterium]